MPVNLTESDTFDPTITVPEAGDDRTAASLVPAFQALTNRTKNLNARTTKLDALVDGDGNLLAVHGFRLYPGARVELGNPIDMRMVIPLRTIEVTAFNASQYIHRQGTKLVLKSDGANALFLRAPIQVPTGTEVYGFGVHAKANGSPINFFLYATGLARGAPFAPPALIELTNMAYPPHIVAGATKYEEGSPIDNVVIDNGRFEYWIEIEIGPSNASNAELYGVDVHVGTSYLPLTF
jgi:hypothetical protein